MTKAYANFCKALPPPSSQAHAKQLNPHPAVRGLLLEAHHATPWSFNAFGGHCHVGFEFVGLRGRALPSPCRVHRAGVWAGGRGGATLALCRSSAGGALPGRGVGGGLLGVVWPQAPVGARILGKASAGFWLATACVGAHWWRLAIAGRCVGAALSAPRPVDLRQILRGG